jgi:hypothetical protein
MTQPEEPLDSPENRQRRSDFPANDNGAPPVVGGSSDTVREIDFGLDVAQAVAALVVKFTEDDLEGSRLLSATRQVARGIYLSASPENREVLAEYAHGQIDVLIARNLVSVPTDLEPTPNHGEPSGRARVYILSNAGFSHAAGQLPVAVTNENQARFDRHVRPVSGQTHLASSTGAAELGPHTEHSFRNHGENGRISPQVDSICLVGLRNESAEPTGYAPLGDVLKFLLPTSISILQAPIFGMEPPDSSEARNGVAYVPILYRRHGKLECAYRADKVRVPDRTDARNAIADLNAGIEKAGKSVLLLPGTAWLARNPRCFHWRDEVRDRSRWLIRSFGLAPYSPASFGDPTRPELMQY